MGRELALILRNFWPFGPVSKRYSGMVTNGSFGTSQSSACRWWPWLLWRRGNVDDFAWAWKPRQQKKYSHNTPAMFSSECQLPSHMAVWHQAKHGFGLWNILARSLVLGCLASSCPNLPWSSNKISPRSLTKSLQKIVCMQKYMYTESSFCWPQKHIYCSGKSLTGL